MLKKRPVAFAIAIALMLLSVAAGAYTSYAAMRNAAAADFAAQIIPLVQEAAVPAFNMQRVAENYLTPAEINTIGLGRIVDEIQSADEPMAIYNAYVALNRAVWAIYDRLARMEIADASRNLATNFHADFLEMDLILSQAGYNNTAREFNEALGGNLGFLARPLIGEMPRFD